MWGGKVRIISTHNGDDNAFNSLLLDARAGRNDYSVHRITLDEACAEGLYRRICETVGERWSPDGGGAYNPAFDVTPAELIAGIVTETGVLRPPYGPAIAALTG